MDKRSYTNTEGSGKTLESKSIPNMKETQTKSDDLTKPKSASKLLQDSEGFRRSGSGAGYNTAFITRLITKRHGFCTDELCSTNHHPMSIEEIKGAFEPARNSTLNTYREIVSMAQLFPGKDQYRYFEEVIEVLKLYRLFLQFLVSTEKLYLQDARLLLLNKCFLSSKFYFFAQ